MLFLIRPVCRACVQPSPSETVRCRGDDPEYSGNHQLELHFDQHRPSSGWFANMPDSCIELLTLVTAQIYSIEKETERAAMLTKRMMETPLPEPPMIMEPTLMCPNGLLRNAVDEHDTLRCPGSWKMQNTWPQARGPLRDAPDLASTLLAGGRLI